MAATIVKGQIRDGPIAKIHHYAMFLWHAKFCAFIIK